MINTLSIKQQQLDKGFFTTGGGSEIVLIMGSCRVCPLVEYLHQWNIQNGNRFTIHSIDPFSWNWDINEKRTGYAEMLKRMETHEGLLAMLRSVNIFIHEYYQNGGMFNTFKNDGKNIYQFGMNAPIDICLPNWNDVFVLFSDIVSFDIDLRKKAIQDYNVIGELSKETQEEIFQKGMSGLFKFFEICLKSDMPEMKLWFQQNMQRKRLWWTFNHVSKHFTLQIFIFLDKWLRLGWADEFFSEISKEDLFANNYTYLSEYDKKWYDFDWGEEVRPLREKL